MKKLTFALMTLLAFTFSLKAQVYVSTMPANRNVILEEFTGRNCQFCPDGHVIANQIAASNPGRFWAINVHTGSYAPTTYPNFNTQDGSSIMSGFSIDGFPTGVINRSTSSGQSRSAWANLTNQQLSQTAECNVAGLAIVDPVTRVATITVEVYYTGNSSVDENYLTVAMLQDSILGSQTGGSTWNPDQMIGNQYVHMHILRDVITSTWGDAISPTTQGTLITRTYEYEIPETIGTPNGVTVNLDHISFLAWVSERHQGTATRPILNACKLEYIQGVDEPNHPIVTGVEIDGLYECTQSKNIDISFQNIGTGDISSMSITAEYGGEIYNEYWEGNFESYGKETIMIPVTAPFGTYDVHVSINEVNGEPYDFSLTTPVTCLEWSDLVIDGEEEELKLQLMQDKFGNQITWEFTAADGTVLGSGGPYDMLAGSSATQIHVERVTVPVNECVRFTIRDSMGNGICCTNGNGYYIVKDSHNNVLIGDTEDGDFGEEASYLISVKGTEEQVEETSEQMVEIYPNPTSGLLTIKKDGMATVEVYNAVGQRMMSMDVNDGMCQVSTDRLANGIYFVRIYANDGSLLNRTFSVAR